MTDRKPSIYIPTLYLAEGLPYAIVNMMSVAFFKSLGAGNEFIGLTSFLSLPWTIKIFWSPLVDIYGTKRRWILGSQVVLAGLIALVSFTTSTPFALAAALCLFSAIALASATQDIAIDGFYLDALNTDKQAFYVGVRNAAYKVSWLFGFGGLVYVAGKLGQSFGTQVGWVAAFAICSALFALAALIHKLYLPHPVSKRSEERLTWPVFVRVFATYFQQDGIAAIVLYILIFRLGDALMLKMAQPFLLDSPDKGGMGISTADLGIIYGTVGTLALLAGGIAGGWLVSAGGLKKWLWPTAIVQNSAILLYWCLAVLKPSIAWVALVNAAEQFSYGLGVAAYTVFLLSTVKPEFKAAHYATATALMALGLMIPGAASGYLATALGYANFFLLSFFASIPGIITIFFLPLDKLTSKSDGPQP